MTGRPLFVRARADADVRAAVDYYNKQAGPDVAARFVDRLQRTYRSISEAPDTGSPRWSHELSVPGLRAMRMRGFPWLVFYLAFDHRVEVLRLLDARSDIPAWMGGGRDA